MTDTMERTIQKIRIESPNGIGYSTRVWLDDKQVEASLEAVHIYAGDVIRVELTIVGASVEFDGKGLVELRDDDPSTSPEAPE